MSPSDRLYNVRLVERHRINNHGIKQYWIEVANPNPKIVVADEKNGFYIVDKDESVIFYSYSDPDKCRFQKIVLTVSDILNR
jgi:hypothetical protein